MEAQIVVRRVQESLLCHPGSELRSGGREKRSAKIMDGKTRQQNKKYK